MRRRWDPAIGHRVVTVRLHPRARIFRGSDPHRIARALSGATFAGSAARGKQMLFGFASAGWLGIHLGMTGSLRIAGAGHHPGRHEHLVLNLDAVSLVLEDARLFGRIRFDPGPEKPEWWESLPPALEGPDFRKADLDAFLQRRRGSPLKAVLLMQERFPGIGNWMADEILWRSRLHPGRKAGALAPDEVARLYREIRAVVRGALKHISRPGEHWGDPPGNWLFHQRWADGGRCPRTGGALRRETIGGRTTCWSPTWQR